MKAPAQPTTHHAQQSAPLSGGQTAASPAFSDRRPAAAAQLALAAKAQDGPGAHRQKTLLERINGSARLTAQRQAAGIIQRVQIPGIYTLTSDSNLRKKVAPHDVIVSLKNGDEVVVEKGAAELSFSLPGLFSWSKDHTWVSTRGGQTGWIKDGNIRFLKKAESASLSLITEEEEKSASLSLITEEEEKSPSRGLELLDESSGARKPKKLPPIPYFEGLRNNTHMTVAASKKLMEESRDKKTGEIPERAKQEHSMVLRREATMHETANRHEKNIRKWIPDNIDLSDSYSVIKEINARIFANMAYSRSYNPPERLLEHDDKSNKKYEGDCRSISEMTKYIAENIFGIANVRIESVADGVRVSGSDNEDDKYTNHHWLNINGQRFDAMDNRDFDFSRWEIHRNKAWRRLSEADIVQGISVNKIPPPAHAP